MKIVVDITFKIQARKEIDIDFIATSRISDHTQKGHQVKGKFYWETIESEMLCGGDGPQWRVNKSQI